MRTTGIIRRVDELGRVVIPSEIRRTMRLKVGSELELFTENDALIVKRFSSVNNMECYAAECAAALSKAADCTVLVADNERIVATSGAGGREYLHRAVSKDVADGFEQRNPSIFDTDSAIEITDGVASQKTQILVPLLVNGDVHGGLIALTENADRARDVLRLTSLAAEVFRTILQ